MWSVSKIRATKGCKLAYEKMISGEPITNEPEPFRIGKTLHEKVGQFFVTKDELHISGFNKTVQNVLRSLTSYDFQIEKYLKDDELEIEGYIDALHIKDDRVFIIDFKSRYDPRITHDDKIQLLIYLYLVMRNYGESNIQDIAILALHNEFEPLEVERMTLSYKTVERFVKRQIELAEERINHMTINTSFCPVCSWVLSCDAKLSDSIEDLARKYIKLESEMKAIKEILKDYVELAGNNLVVDNYNIGMHTKERTKVNKEELIRVCESLNMRPFDVLSVDLRQVKKIAKQYDEIANLIGIEHIYEFGIKKVEVENGGED